MHAPDPWSLPSPLHARAETLLLGLLGEPGRPLPDFRQPAGEPALLPADSITWRLFKNPATLFIGGIAAVVLELAEPRVGAGVWRHSDFQRAPVARLRRTGLATLMTVYGPRSQAIAMIEGVGRRHAAVHGVDDDGLAYDARDPVLLDWVHATASACFIDAWHRWVAPLTDAERDQALAEGLTAARLYGAPNAPGSLREWQALLDATLPRLRSSPPVHEFLAMVRRMPALPRAGQPLQALLVRAGLSMLPPELLRRLGLERDAALAGWQRALVRRVARAADGLQLERWPPVQACRRLGLPPGLLYLRSSATV